MPKLTTRTPKYRLHKATGQAAVTIAGKHYYLGKHKSIESKMEYERLIAAWLACGRDPAQFQRQQHPYQVGDILHGFLIFAREYYIKDGLPTSELNAYKQVIKTTLELYATTPVDEFGPVALKLVRAQWLEAGLARSTINRNQRRLVRMFKWACEEEMVSASVWQSLDSVASLKKGRSAAPESVPVPPVSLDAVHKTIPHLSPVVADMVRLQLLTGMRPGEVCMVCPGAIETDGDVWEFRPTSHKTAHHDRSRIIYLGPQAQAIISPYLERDSELRCFSPAESKQWWLDKRAKERKTPPNEGNARGRRGNDGRKPAKRSRKPRNYFDSASYGHRITDGCARAWPVPDEMKDDAERSKEWIINHRWTPNQIRHTRATEIRKQFGLEAAQVILGHATADVTQIYAERDAETAREVVRNIG